MHRLKKGRLGIERLRSRKAETGKGVKAEKKKKRSRRNTKN